MRVIADTEICIGAGSCVLMAPEVFDQDAADGRVRLRAAQVEDRDAPLVREAVGLCPSGALSIVDESA